MKTSRFNPRTPCGVRRMTWPKGQWNPWFQSTHSLRSATTLEVDGGFVSKVSIHALLAECDGRGADEGGRPCGFNPRTPCGVRRYPGGVQELLERFQSTHSLRSATDRMGVKLGYPVVSIHALLAECDQTHHKPAEKETGFNPRTPCGVRQIVGKVNYAPLLFQSTHSLRSATINISLRFPAEILFQSTHSLRSATGFHS